MRNATYLTHFNSTYFIENGSSIETLPFHKWLLVVGNNAAEFWIIGLSILIFIIFGLIIYKFSKQKDNEVKDGK